jgi:hypothetical protein
MIRNAKLLGLALIAVLALTALGSSSASAAKFTAAKYPVTLSGTQSTSHKLTVGGSTVTCTTATFKGEGKEASETQTIFATYTGCTAFGFINATVTGSTCDYLLNANGNIALNCTSGDVTVDAGPCTATLTAAKNQTLTSNTFTNNTPAAGQVTVDTNVTNAHAEITKSEFGCPVAKGTYATSTYTGSTVVKGTDSEGKADSIDVA